MYQGRSNKSHSTFGVGGYVVTNLRFTLPQQENHKAFDDNFFTSLPLIEHLKVDGIWYTGTIRALRLKNCPLLVEKDIKKGGIVLTTTEKKIGRWL